MMPISASVQNLLGARQFSTANLKRKPSPKNSRSKLASLDFGAPKAESIQPQKGVPASRKKSPVDSHNTQFIKANEHRRKQDRNYQLLITDCYEQVKFLNQVPLNVLEQALEHFRENVFSVSDRKKIPHLIYQVVEKELILENEDAISASDSDSEQGERRLTLQEMTEGSVDQMKLLETSK